MNNILNIPSEEPLTTTRIKGFNLTITYHGVEFHNVHYRYGSSNPLHGLFRLSCLQLQFGRGHKIPYYYLDTYTSSRVITNRPSYHQCNTASLVHAAFEASLGLRSDIEKHVRDLDAVIEEPLCMSILKQALLTQHLLHKHKKDLMALKYTIQETGTNKRQLYDKLYGHNVYVLNTDIDLSEPVYNKDEDELIVESNGEGHRVLCRKPIKIDFSGLINRYGDYLYDRYMTGTHRIGNEVTMPSYYGTYDLGRYYNTPQEEDD